jgi:hypothetical protein
MGGRLYVPLMDLDQVSRGNGELIIGQDSPDPNLFATEVRNCAGTPISLGIFSAKVRSTWPALCWTSPAHLFVT